MSEETTSESPRRRELDRSLLCRIAFRAGQAWDFIDKRDIDKHLVSIVILYGTVQVTRWAFGFATQWLDIVIAGKALPGLEVAAVIAAVTAPYITLQGAAIAFYFKART
jgi:hypothetical protein